MISWVSGVEILFDRRPPYQMEGATYALKMNDLSSSLLSRRELSRVQGPDLTGGGSKKDNRIRAEQLLKLMNERRKKKRFCQQLGWRKRFPSGQWLSAAEHIKGNTVEIS